MYKPRPKITATPKYRSSGLEWLTCCSTLPTGTSSSTTSHSLVCLACWITASTWSLLLKWRKGVLKTTNGATLMSSSRQLTCSCFLCYISVVRIVFRIRSDSPAIKASKSLYRFAKHSTSWENIVSSHEVANMGNSFYPSLEVIAKRSGSLILLYTCNNEGTRLSEKLRVRNWASRYSVNTSTQ